MSWSIEAPTDSRSFVVISCFIEYIFLIMRNEMFNFEQENYMVENLITKKCIIKQNR